METTPDTPDTTTPTIAQVRAAAAVRKAAERAAHLEAATLSRATAVHALALWLADPIDARLSDRDAARDAVASFLRAQGALDGLPVTVRGILPADGSGFSVRRGLARDEWLLQNSKFHAGWLELSVGTCAWGVKNKPRKTTKHVVLWTSDVPGFRILELCSAAEKAAQTAIPWVAFQMEALLNDARAHLAAESTEGGAA